MKAATGARRPLSEDLHGGNARKSALVFLNHALGAVLGIVAIKLTSYYLGPRVIGEFDAAVGFLGLLYFITDLGFGQAHTKRVSEGKHPGDCLSTFAWFKAVTTALFVFVSLAIVAFRVVVLQKPLEDATPVTILVALAYMTLKSVAAVPGATFDAKRETARSQAVQLVETVSRVALTVPVALLIAAALERVGPFAGGAVVGSPIGAFAEANPGATLGLTWAASAAIAAAVGFFYLPSSTRWGRFRLDILKSYWVYALPIFLVGAVHVLSTYIDKAALAYFWHAEEVGRFSQPRRITAFIETLPSAVMLLLFPAISAMHVQGRHDEIDRTAHRAERYVSMLVFPVVAVLLVYPGDVIRIGLSDRWQGAEWTLRWLAVYALFIAVTRPSVAVLLGVDRPGVAARIGVAMAATNILLTLLLVPPALKIVPLPLPGLADLGAAIATAASGAVGFVMFRHAAGKATTRPSSRFMLVHLAAAVVAGGVMLLLAGLPAGPMRWWHLGLFSAVGGAVYFAVLVAFDEFTREDRRFFRDALHLGDLGRYVKGEMRR